MYGLEVAEWRDQAISSEIEKTVMNSLLRYWGWGGDDVQTNDEFAETVEGLFRLQGGSRCANGCGGRDSPRPKSGYSASSESLGGKEGGLYGWRSDSEGGDGDDGDDGDGDGDGGGDDGDGDRRGRPFRWRTACYERDPSSTTSADRLRPSVRHCRSKSGRGAEREGPRIGICRRHQTHYDISPVPSDGDKTCRSDADEEDGGVGCCEV